MNKMMNTNNLDQKQQEEIIQRTLKTGGFLFPESVEEVEAYERVFGETNFMLPEDLQEPFFLDFEIDVKKPTVTLNNFNIIAMAARDGKEIPENIKEKMKKERELARRKNLEND